MAASLSQNLGSLLECPVCMEEMDVPKGLPCHHTVCAKCLKGTLQQGTHKLKCPVCRQQVILGLKGVDGLPNNPILMNMKDLIKSKESRMKDDPGVKVSSYLFTDFNKFPNEHTQINVDFTVEEDLKDFTILPSGELITISQDNELKKYDPDGKVIAVSPLVIDASESVIYHEGMQKILITNLSQIIYALDPISLELVSKIKLALDNFQCWDVCSIGLMIAARSLEERAIGLFQSDGSLHGKIYPKEHIIDCRVNKQGTAFATTRKGVLTFDLEKDGTPQKLIISLTECESSIEIDPNENLWILDGPMLSVYQGSLGFAKILNIDSIPAINTPTDIHCSKSGQMAIKDDETGFVTVFTVK